MIDSIYFQSTMEYRKRTIVLLEATLRYIGSTRSYKLNKTICECYTMFKLGVTSVSSPSFISQFQESMAKTFDGPMGIPRIIITELDIVNPDEEKIATEDASSLEMQLTRVHGENFMKQKIAMAIKQGIPPQIALQTFREGWWILLRCKKLGGDSNGDEHAAFIDKHPMFANCSTDILEKFKKEKPEDLLINAWPFVVSNMQQLGGKVKLGFVAPKVPGKYKFYIDIKSQDYLGCDQAFTLEKEILDKGAVVRAEKKKVKEEGDDAATTEEEPKKTK